MKDREHSIFVKKQFAASPDRLYAAFTDLALMRLWMGAKVEADVRIGGRYRIDNVAGGQVFVHVGEYLVLEAGRRIVQSFRAGPGEPDPNTRSPYLNESIEIALRPISPGETELSFINGWDGEPLEREGREAVRHAWSEWLERLETALRVKQTKEQDNDPL